MSNSTTNRRIRCTVKSSIAGKTITLLFAILFASGLTSRAQNTWTQKADFGINGREGAVGFSIGSKGYIGTGVFYDNTDNYYKDFWEYDPDTDIWTQKADFGGTARKFGVGFCIEGKGYLGTGWDGNFCKDVWKYTPDFGVEIPFINNDESTLSVFPNLVSEMSVINFQLSDDQKASVQIFDLNGRLIRTLADELMNEGTQKLTWDARDEKGNKVSDGIYFIRMKTDSKVKTIAVSVAG